METIKTENKPSWFKYLHKLNGWNWRKRLGNFRCNINWDKLGKEERKEIGPFYAYYNIRNAKFLEVRKSKLYKVLISKIRLEKILKGHYIRRYLQLKQDTINEENVLERVYIKTNIEYVKGMIKIHKESINIYKKELLDLIRNHLAKENP